MFGLRPLLNKVNSPFPKQLPVHLNTIKGSLAWNLITFSPLSETNEIQVQTWADLDRVYLHPEKTIPSFRNAQHLNYLSNEPILLHH